jgi:hypothetical protein
MFSQPANSLNKLARFLSAWAKRKFRVECGRYGLPTRPSSELD